MNTQQRVDKEFIEFLIKAKTNGYASGESSVKIKEYDSSKTITFSEGKYKYHDNYFGGEPYGGREVVFIQGKPFWMMVYYGRVFENKNISVKEIYSFLQKALKTIPAEAPYRGDRIYEEYNFFYMNLWAGTIENFSGKETLSHKGLQVYEASYLGGLVDIQKNV